MKTSTLMLAEIPSGVSARISQTVDSALVTPSEMVRVARPTNLGTEHSCYNYMNIQIYSYRYALLVLFASLAPPT